MRHRNTSVPEILPSRKEAIPLLGDSLAIRDEKLGYLVPFFS